MYVSGTRRTSTKAPTYDKAEKIILNYVILKNSLELC